MPFHLLVISQETSRPVALASVAGSLAEHGIEVVVRAAADLGARGGELAREAAAADCVLLTHLLSEPTVERAMQLLRGHARPDADVLVLQSLRELMLETRIAGTDLRTLGAGHPMLEALLNAKDMTTELRGMVEALPAMLARTDLRPELRVFLETLLYWREPTPANLRHLVLMLADRLGKRAGLPAYGSPEILPAAGLYHPSTGVVGEACELPAPDTPAGTVGLLVMRGSVLAGDTKGVDAVITAFESRGVHVLPAFAGAFDFRGPIERWFDPAKVDAVVSLTGFPLVGGHNRHEGDEARVFLTARGVPYFTPPGLMTQSIEEWQRSRLGLSPMEAAMQLAIHEAEGGIEPVVIHGAPVPGGAKTALAGRAERFADRVAAWLRLRRTPNRDKRVLLTLFSFPPGKGSVGTAAYLDVFASAHAVLRRLRDEGFRVEVPAGPGDLLARVVTGEDARAPFASAELAVGARLTPAEYERMFPEWRRLRRQWGEPPGQLDTDGRDLLIHGAELGNVFIGVQPSFGFEGDPMRLLFEPSATPSHAFVAYYRWAESVFCAHAIVHVGTHGALEFMPGKQTGLSGECWPDVLAGSVPNVYLYAVNNPSEGTIAKRRGNAVTIGHLTPPAEQAGLYRDLDEIRALLRDLAAAEDEERRARLAAVLVDKTAGANLDREVPLPGAPHGPEFDAFVDRLAVQLQEIATRRIPVGLHVVGRRPEAGEARELLAAVAEHDRPDAGVRSVTRLLLEGRGDDPDRVEAGIRAGDRAAVERWTQAAAETRRIVDVMDDGAAALARAAAFAAGVDAAAMADALEFLRSVARRLTAGDELAPLVAALEGRYVPPGPGGDPVRAPDVLPAGRNIHALDPASVPSAAAMHHAEAAVDLLLARRRRELGHWPRRIGMVLWGLDNIKTQGEAIAQAFLLLGVRPRRNSIGRVAELDVVSLAELGRPRIDIVLSASGIFRDVFALQLDLLDRAVRAVAALDEPLEQNYVRAGVAALVRRVGPERAASRVFSNEPGSYGTHVDHMVGLSAWRQRSDLAGVWLRRKSFAFGGGAAHADAEAMSALAEGIDTTFQNIDSSEVSLIDVDHYFEYLGGMTALVEQASGRRPDALVADTTTATTRVRALDEAVRLEARSKLLNPRWFEGMLRHGYEGVEEIRKRFDYTFGWSATAQAVDDWVYRDVYRTFVRDTDVRDRMRDANPHSFQAFVARLGEADSRGFWKPTDEERADIREQQDLMEDALEGIESGTG